MQFLIVTGLSGSGKSCAINVLEDIGYYCIDNMPPQLLRKFAEICENTVGKIDRVAVVMDIRGGELFFGLQQCIDEMREQGINVKILFLDASDDVLVHRYKETRRKHPLDESMHGGLLQAVIKERETLMPVRETADFYIDTSNISSTQLKEQVNSIFLENVSDFMMVTVASFGFKYGTLSEADIILDVRCLPNPFYIKELKLHTGLEECVSDYVMSFDEAQQLLEKLTDMIDFLLPLYIKEGKSQLVVAFGCTGGKHRSVTFAEKLYSHLKENKVRARIFHRDIGKE